MLLETNNIRKRFVDMKELEYKEISDISKEVEVCIGMLHSTTLDED